MKSSKSSLANVKKSKWFAPLLIVGGIVVGGVLMWGVLISMESFQKDLINQPVYTDINSKIDVASVDSKNLNNKDLAVELDRTEELSVTWHDPEFLTDPEVADFFGVEILNASTSSEDFHEMVFRRLWRAGVVQGGGYDGMTIYAMDYMLQGMGSYDGFQYLIRNHDGRIYGIGDAVGYNQDLWLAMAQRAIGSKITLLPNISIPSLFVPDELTINGGKIYRVTDGYFAWSDMYRFDFDQKKLRKTGVAGSFDVFTYGEDSCLYIFTQDGFTHRFTTRIDFKLGSSGAYDSQRPDITWNVSDADSGPYEYRVLGGCGAWGCSNVVAETDVKPNLLIVAGHAKDGSTIFVPKDPTSHFIVQSQYANWYDPTAEDGKKPSIDVFLSRVKTPIFFWKDALGRWIQYTSTNAVGMVECGKPVIYLYPEKKTDVHVKLPSFIDVTVSDPQYPVAGWNVIASPNGDLVSHDDGKTYGSLYWEGTGVGYQVPKTGFIVKDGDVSLFLTKTLPKYGLNQKEMNEFMDFWVPRMKGASYYQVSFLTNEWSKSAPLHVSPRPQTNIRIFMDWKPLSAPVSIEEPKIVTPERKGFTLVEWGGLLYK